jgi:hypothetical protein
MNYSKSDIEEARRLADQAQAQVDAQAQTILDTRRSGAYTGTADRDLETKAQIRDQAQAQLRRILEGVGSDNSS